MLPKVLVMTSRSEAQPAAMEKGSIFQYDNTVRQTTLKETKESQGKTDEGEGPGFMRPPRKTKESKGVLNN